MAVIQDKADSFGDLIDIKKNMRVDKFIFKPEFYIVLK